MRRLKLIELWGRVFWAVVHHKIDEQHLQIKYWHNCEGTSLFFILKQKVLMWYSGSDFEPGKVLFIAPTGVIYELDNKNIECTLDAQYNPLYYFKMPPAILYGLRATTAIRKIIIIQITYDLTINFKHGTETNKRSRERADAGIVGNSQAE